MRLMILTLAPLALANALIEICTSQLGTDYVCCDLLHQRVNSVEACCALCNSTLGCLAWKFDTTDPGQICFLKTGIGNPVACEHCVVGVKPPRPPLPTDVVGSCVGPSRGLGAPVLFCTATLAGVPPPPLAAPCPAPVHRGWSPRVTVTVTPSDGNTLLLLCIYPTHTYRTHAPTELLIRAHESTKS